MLSKHSKTESNVKRRSWIVFNPFKPSGVKWLHFKAFSAILV